MISTKVSLWVVLHILPYDRRQECSYSLAAVIFSQRFNGRGVKLTTRLHLAPCLIMTGAVHPLPVCFFLLWTRRALRRTLPAGSVVLGQIVIVKDIFKYGRTW